MTTGIGFVISKRDKTYLRINSWENDAKNVSLD